MFEVLLLLLRCYKLGYEYAVFAWHLATLARLTDSRVVFSSIDSQFEACSFSLSSSCAADVQTVHFQPSFFSLLSVPAEKTKNERSDLTDSQNPNANNNMQVNSSDTYINTLGIT
jgi:hypothetical protein